ncbi:hypothetical protein pqer_cds_501 [Pandoravirus quercus]|uniref:Uncharacterized protein n=2 Tax=Pandoravirus TaxID=2060084 RepID=A0A2U7U910_9VIRU|nr:hypothetical protein pqer_cds_501 [Pandoravirus quercus]AVK74923.1 hypothetical protein pqer_cds_501 [Pandoravirus quercus]QBZ81110.1 hypothetical protein pclt_cds_516 [Pandoravirus celtis]
MDERMDNQSPQGAPASSQPALTTSHWNPLAAARDLVWNVASTLAPYTFPRDTDAASCVDTHHAGDEQEMSIACRDAQGSESDPVRASHGRTPRRDPAPRSGWVTLAATEDEDESRVLRCRRTDDAAGGWATFDAVLTDSIRERNPKWHGRPGLYGPMGPTGISGNARNKKYITLKRERKATITRPVDAPWPTEAELLAVFGASA